MKNITLVLGGVYIRSSPIRQLGQLIRLSLRLHFYSEFQ